MAVHDMMIRIGAQVTPGFESSLRKAFSGFQGAMGMLGGLGIGGAAATVFGMGSAKLKEQSHLKDYAESLGVSVDYLARLQQVASVSGSGIDTIGMALGQMVTAASTAPDKFAKLGINVREVNGELKDARTLFDDVMASLLKETNATERASMAKSIFRGSYMEMLPIIRDYNQEMKRTAGLTDQAANSAEQYEKNLNRIWGNLKSRAGAATGGILTEAAAFGAEVTAPGGPASLMNTVALGGRMALQGNDSALSGALSVMGNQAAASASPAVYGLYQVGKAQHTLWKAAAEKVSSLISGAVDAAGGY